jgi:hypothetical protein
LINLLFDDWAIQDRFISASQKSLNSISTRKKDLKISAVFTLAQTLSDSLLIPGDIQVSYGEGGGMAGRRSSVGFTRSCDGAFGMTPAAITPPAQVV